MKLMGGFKSILDITEERIVIWKIGEEKSIQNEAWGDKRVEKYGREDVFVFYCRVTNYHKLSGLKQNNNHL